MTTIGVVVVTFNHAPHLRGCLDSIRRQTRPPDRIVVVDDGSGDGTQELVRELGTDVEFLQTDRLGPSCAFNRGVEHVSTDVVATIAGDDECLPHRLERQAELLHRHDATLVMGLPEVMDDAGTTRADTMTPEFFVPFGQDALPARLFVNGNFLCAPTATFRRAAYLELGGYHPGLLQLQDFHLWVRWSWRSMLVVDERFVRYRKSSNSLSSPTNDRRMHAEQLWVYRHFFDGVADDAIRRAFEHESPGATWDRELFVARLYLDHGDRLVRQIGCELLLDLAGAPGGVDLLSRAGFTMQDVFAVLGEADVRGDAERQSLLDELVAGRMKLGGPIRLDSASRTVGTSTANGAWR